ncbi:hypothetical protein OAS39_09840 [Pirellulales bacterium]|nr:hypothetical protein [Pirellulales bacterium]
MPSFLAGMPSRRVAAGAHGEFFQRDFSVSVFRVDSTSESLSPSGDTLD